VALEEGMGHKKEQRRTTVAPWSLHCSCCGWQKGMSRDEASSISEEIRPAALAIIELHLSERLSK